ncbi:uncharacterized protein LOC128552407 [Mercenaria mercenaria]|uniref:uncharacterized protein LOC128552407 n=1 Tax=Mercenaria mercenaria TaxID=6596 RepID=UPI00234F0223|nr:uncharacterized protein LOC128552407 [Mercenaria mercenaria]XP_053389413.1 uncharacterized protein LOC128552407 [Mercenaria mercenaria]XP_053389414.1 uncharacterized protein LOC128552407 [Mercenaria mercenaria]
MSFKRLNQNIFDTFNSYGVEFCSSDDTNIDRKVLEYENSPQVDYQSAYRKLCKTSENELGKLENKNKQLSEEIRKTRNEMKEQLDNEKETSKKVEERMHQCKEENTELAAKMKVLEKRLSELEANKISARNIIEELKRDKERLEGNLKDLKEHRPVSIQLYYQVKGDMTSKMLDALKSMLVTQMGVERNELQFIVCQNELDVNPELPLLVFCISASRLGTDASTVLQNLNVSAKVSVLIFHHKDIHALPNQSSERVLTGPEFKALGGIFDIAFLSDKGIYPCDMNQTAAVGIESFLRTQS